MRTKGIMIGVTRMAVCLCALIVVSSTLSGFLLAVLYALLLAWWRRNHAALAHRLKTAGTDPAPPPVETSA